MEVEQTSNAPRKSIGGGEGAAAAVGPTRSIKIHPLGIIGISDHHTRVVTGGSALPPNAPVVGLLFGYYSNDRSSGSGGKDVSIVDVEEMEYPKSDEGDDVQSSQRAAVLKKIELHQKVFPQHKVVGWYRVQKQNDENSMNIEDSSGGGVMPSEEDLRMNQTEMARYCSGSTGEGSNDEDAESPLFVLMNAAKTAEDNNGGDKKPSSSSSNNASEEMEVDEELPLTVYETLVTTAEASAVFVNADFELETYEPERIAVEKVFKTQPSKSTVALAAKDAAATADTADAKEEGADAAASGDESRKAGKKSKKDDDKQQQKSSKPAFTRGPTELDILEDSLQSSIRAMNIRMNVLLEYLQKVKAGEITTDDTLLRNIDGLIRQLPLVLAALEEGQAVSNGTGGNRKPLHELENEHSNTMLLTYLAAVAKTAKSVHIYSEKFRAVGEGKSDRRNPMMY